MKPDYEYFPSMVNKRIESIIKFILKTQSKARKYLEYLEAHDIWEGDNETLNCAFIVLEAIAYAEEELVRDLAKCVENKEEGK